MSLNRKDPRSLRNLATAIGVIIALAACGDDNDDGDGTLAVAVAPTSINVAPGATGTSTATITRGGSFTGPVTMGASGAPAGVTVSFTPADVASGSTTAAVNVSVAGGTAAGTHDLTITASGDGVDDAGATLTLVIVSAAAGSFTLAADPNTLTVPAGGAAQVSNLTITRTAPFAGPVALTVTGAPANVTASVTPTSATGNTATLTVQATAAAVNTTYPLTVRGVGTGVPDATTSVAVTITGGVASGVQFTFAPTPLPITAGGASGNSTVTITRSAGYTDGLNLALSGAPAGMTASVAPNSNVTGNTATITVQATNAVAGGTYNLTLTGTGPGIPNATGTLPVQVTGSGGGGGSANAVFCTADAPIWVAMQSGSGAWTRVLPTSGSSYTFNFTSGTGGVAIVDTVGTGFDLSVFYASVTDFQRLGSNISFGGCGAKTVSGTVANVPATDVATVSLGSSSTIVIAALTSAFQLQGVPDGPQDLFSARASGTTFNADRIILRRNQNIANNGTIPVLDFNAAEAFLAGTANVTVANLGTDDASILALFLGDGSTFGITSTVADYTAASGAVPYSAVPGGNLVAGELQQLLAVASSAANLFVSRSSATYFAAPANRTLTMGPALSTPTVTKVVTAPNARPRVQLPSQAEYNRLVTAAYDQDGLNRGATIAATAGYFGTAPATWDLTIPDFTGVSGWNPTWGLQDGTGIDWSVTADGGTILFLDPTIPDGSTTQSATRSSQTPLAIRSARASQDRYSVIHHLITSLAKRSAGRM